MVELERTEVRAVLAQACGTGFALVDHFGCREDANKAAAKQDGPCLVVQGKILFAGNGNIRKWDMCL